MTRFLIALFVFISTQSKAQVFNQGYNHTSYKNMITNGITYIKTGDAVFDSVMIETLEDHWKISSFTSIERYKEPDQNSTALFLTTMKRSKEHFQDRKNQEILVLLPAKFFDEGADYEMNTVNIEKTIGYMYFNGFQDVIPQKDQYRFLKMMIVSLHEGLTMINEKQFIDVQDVEAINTSVSSAIIEKHKGLVGNTLIIHRDQIAKYIDIEKVKASGIRYRLLADDEYNAVLEKEDPSHYVLYFGNNLYTELSLIRIQTGEIIYTKHFHNDVTAISKKEMKAIFAYFR